MKTASITLAAAVRALMRGTGMNKDEAKRHLIQAFQEGKLPLLYEDVTTGKTWPVPVGAVTRLQ